MNRVSIIIPAYNSAQYLPDAIQSCLNQTHKDIEILVVDDGSTDDTKNVVQRFPVTYIYQNNKGPAAARNTGWNAANSEYLQFLDADDVLLPTKIERCLKAFTPDIDVVYTDYEYRSPDLREKVPTPHTGAPEGNILDTLLQHARSIFPPHAPLIRRLAAEKTRKFNEQIIITEDWYFWIELAASGARFKHLDEILALYRSTSDGLSNNSLLMARARLTAVEELKYLALPPTFDLNRALADRNHMLAMRLWEVGEKAKAREYLRKSIKLSKKRSLAQYFLLLTSYFTTLNEAENYLNHVLKFRDQQDLAWWIPYVGVAVLILICAVFWHFMGLPFKMRAHKKLPEVV